MPPRPDRALSPLLPVMTLSSSFPVPDRVVVDRGRQVIDVEALVVPARAVVRRVPAGPEQHADSQVCAGGGVVILPEMEVVVVLERRGGSDQRAIEIDADVIVVGPST